MIMLDDTQLFKLRQFLAQADHFAMENVKAGRGGPFGAALHVYCPAQKLWIQVGDFAANAVLEKGIASAHAENEILSPTNIAQLKDILRNTGPDALVVLTSSGESCPACHAKEEIVARHLLAEGLLETSFNFIVTYGATYADTLTVAGFNDAPYLVDMQRPAQEQTIRRLSFSLDDLPAPVAHLFRTAPEPLAVVAHGDTVMASGLDQRGHDLIATPEVSAIRTACRLRKEQQHDRPFDLGAATLYTSTLMLGPLAYAECLWANITTCISVNDSAGSAFAWTEAPTLSNTEFFKVVARHDPQASALTLLHLPEGFKNMAQQAWRARITDEIATTGHAPSLYNGATIYSDQK